MIHIVLYHPEIAQNCGNIIRTCQATGSSLHLIKPLGFSLDDKNLLRSSMDYIDDCEIYTYENFDEFYKLHQDDKLFFITRYGMKSYSEIEAKDVLQDYYLIFGSESSGIDYKILKDHLSSCYRIPMKVNSRSLNLSNCVSIVTYELLRQEDYFSLAKKETFKGENFLNEFDKK